MAPRPHSRRLDLAADLPVQPPGVATVAALAHLHTFQGKRFRCTPSAGPCPPGVGSRACASSHARPFISTLASCCIVLSPTTTSVRSPSAVQKAAALKSRSLQLLGSQSKESCSRRAGSQAQALPPTGSSWSGLAWKRPAPSSNAERTAACTAAPCGQRGEVAYAAESQLQHGGWRCCHCEGHRELGRHAPALASLLRSHQRIMEERAVVVELGDGEVELGTHYDPHPRSPKN